MPDYCPAENIRIFACYPPGIRAIRSEERCQAEVEEGITLSDRACNDLGYIAAIALQHGMTPMIRDYPSEKLFNRNYLDDLGSFRPDLLIISCTTGSIPSDIEAIKSARKICPDISVMVKGAFFTSLTDTDICDNSGNSRNLKALLQHIDFAVQGEIERVLQDLLPVLEKTDYIRYRSPNTFSKALCNRDIPGLMYKVDGEWRLPGQIAMVTDLNSMPYPARNLMNNRLYQRPDTGHAMATIECSRGCPASCIYCLTPVISGSTIRKRSSESIVDEIRECVNRYNIRDFYFRSDTFTMDECWVQDLCAMIITSGLKISWVANSRTAPLSYKTLTLMKKAGCWLVAAGFESASKKTLKLIKKGTTLRESHRAANLIRKAGMQLYGFFMIGFPWEDEKDIRRTGKLAIDLDCDYVEFHIVTAFKNTELHKMLAPEGACDIDTGPGINYFSNPNRVSALLSVQELIELRKEILLRFYVRPAYITKRLLSVTSIHQLKAYAQYGLKVLRLCLRKTG